MPPLRERTYTEPHKPQADLDQQNPPYQNLNNQEEKVIYLNRLEGMNPDTSDFGSSDGTNMHLNCPAGIHQLNQLTSPHGSLLAHTQVRNTLHTTKNFEYHARMDNLLTGASRNEPDAPMYKEKTSSKNSGKKSSAVKSSDKKQALVGTQKISFLYQQLDVSKSPYKRSFNMSINDEIHLKSVTQSTPAANKDKKKTMKKHRKSCFEDHVKSSPMVKEKLRISKDDSLPSKSLKTKRYQTMRSSDLTGLNKPLGTTHQNRHLQSTQIIKQMKQEAKASAQPKKLGVSSPKTKNHSVSGNQMFKHDGDDTAFEIGQDQLLDEQYRKVIGIPPERDMNARTLSGPIVFQQDNKAGANKQSNDCLLRQVTKDKHLAKNESQPPSNKDYMKGGKGSLAQIG